MENKVGKLKGELEKGLVQGPELLPLLAGADSVHRVCSYLVDGSQQFIAGVEGYLHLWGVVVITY